MGWAIGMLAAAVVVRFDDVADRYAAAVLASLAFVVLFGMVGWMFGLGPVLRPVGDLLSGTERVARGDFAKRLPVTSNDELGRLRELVNRMQTGLLERERLHSAVRVLRPTLPWRPASWRKATTCSRVSRSM